MNVLKKTAAAGMAAVAVCVVATVLGRAAPQGGGVPACMSADGTLRVLSAGELCRTGETGLYLKEDGGAPGAPSNPTKSPAKPDSLHATAVDLHARVRALEDQPLFEVVSPSGVRIFSVGPGSAHVYNSLGQVVATMRATDAGGYFRGQTSTGSMTATIGTYGSRTGMVVTENGLLLVDVGKQQGGNFALRFPAPGGGVVAGIGESRAGTGVISVGDMAGWLRTWLSVDAERKGNVAALNGVTTIAAISEGATGGGLFTVFDPSGEPMVKAGVTDKGYGILLTGPAAGLPLVPATGLPGSYIIGSTGR